MAPWSTRVPITASRNTDRGPGPLFVRRAVSGLLVLMGATGVALYAGSATQRAEHGADLLAAGLLNLALAALLLLFVGRLTKGPVSQTVTAVALGTGSSAVVLAAGGAHGMFNLAVPIIVLAAAALLTFRRATLFTLAVLGLHVASTFLHGPFDGHAAYELAEALGIAAVALVGVHTLKRSLIRQAARLEIANEELSARIRELDALHELALGAGAAISRDELAHRGLEVAAQLSGGDAGVLWLKTAGESFSAAALRGYPEGSPVWRFTRRLDELGPAAAVVRARTTLLFEGTAEVAGAVFGTTEPGTPDDPKTEPEHAVTSVTPLRAGDTLVGVMVIVHRTGRRPGDNVLAAMETLSVELALLLDRKRKAALVEGQRRQLEALNEIASGVTASLEVQTVLDYAVTQTAALMEADVAFIATTVGDTEDLRIVSHRGFRTDAMAPLLIVKGRGIGGRVARDQRVHQSVDYCMDGRLEDEYKQAVAEEGLVTLIGAPLVNRRHVVGVLYAARRHRQVFTAAEAHLLSMLGVQVAVALENARLFEDVTELSVRDPLTGAYNRRFFDQRLEEEVSRTRRSGNPTSLLIIDVDDFKRYNDSHGHARGDILLKELVALCVSSVRASDIVGRYGGEEFVVLFPDTDISAAVVVAARIHAAVRRNLGQRLGEDHPLSVSGGVAELDPLDPDPVALVERADRALYAAKAAGKDRVVVDRSPTGEADPGVERTVEPSRARLRAPVPRETPSA